MSALPAAAPPPLLLDLFGDPLRPPTRRERHRVATQARGAAPAAPPKPSPPVEPVPACPTEPVPSTDLPHPLVWRAHELGRSSSTTEPSGHPLLDAELPGGGWPTRAVTELLLPSPGSVEWRLLAPALARRLGAAPPKSLSVYGRAEAGAAIWDAGQGATPQPCPAAWRGFATPPSAQSARHADPDHGRASSQKLLLIAPPHQPHPRGLAAFGIAPRHCLWVDAEAPRERAWTLEQALKADPDELAAVLAWLPQLRPEQMRRLNTLAAGCRALVFVLRPGVKGEASQSSAAPLRLCARPGAHWSQVEVQLLKRHGPPLETALLLSTAPATLQAVLPLPEPRAPRRRVTA